LATCYKNVWLSVSVNLNIEKSIWENNFLNASADWCKKNIFKTDDKLKNLWTT
jgi:hypothetical protein